MPKQLAIAWIVLSAALWAAKSDHPTGSRITPPILRSVTPLGVARGTTVEITVEGQNLAGASAVYFSEPGIQGRIVRIKELPDLPEVRLGSNGTPSTIDLGPLPPRHQVTLELDVAPDADVGVVKFRLLTPLGTTPEGQFLIEPYYGESPDREPNDTPETAFETVLPSILAGTIARPGDVDCYKIQVKAGEELVFDDGAVELGSQLQPVVDILAADGSLLRRYGMERPEHGARFAHRFESAGVYYVRIADYQGSGRAANFYRYKVGRFAVVDSVYPLGLRRGESREFAFSGPGLAPSKSAVDGQASPHDENAAILRPKTPLGRSFRTVRLALGDEPEVEAAGTNTTPATAQRVTLPATINGRIQSEQYFRFAAHKGQQFVFEVIARRLGSELDSEIAVLDARGKPVERAVVRAISETFTVLRDHDSVQRGIRIQSWSNLAVGDYLMIGQEIVRIESLPRGPDDDFIAENFGGQRIAHFGTTSEAHAVDKPVYKVQIHPPGSQFTPNGLPLVRLDYRNDDGGPGYGKDSYLHFTAPADGEYLLRLRDVRGPAAEPYPYRLSARAPKPDFRLAVNPRNPNVPRGGWIPITVTAQRLDGFDGPIALSVEGLPKGVACTTGVIAAGQISTTLLLSAQQDAQLEQAVAFRVVGRASVAGRQLVHAANPEDNLKLLALMPAPDVLVTAETREVVLEPGATAEIRIRLARQRDFGGRVPIQVLNLPPRVRVLDVGLNGVLVNEDENSRSFTIEALASATPGEQIIYVAGAIETRSPLPTVYAAPEPIRLVIRPASVAKRAATGQAAAGAQR